MSIKSGHNDSRGRVIIVGAGPGDPDLIDIDWQALAKLKHTLVFYMGLSKAQEIQVNLLAAGLAPKTPVAIVENGSRDNQREVIGELQSLSDLIVRHKLCSPALILVGDVVAEAQKLEASRATIAYAQTALSEAEFAVNQCA